MSEEPCPVEQLAQQIMYSPIPDTGDGICNAHRTYYILEVWDVTHVNLNQRYPFEALLQSRDPEKVRASLYLAKIQFQFNEACRHKGFIDDHDADQFNIYLHHSIRSLAHHLKYVDMGRPTPPLGFH